MADGLNLATLNVAVQATGVQQAQQQVDNLTSSVQRSGSTTQQSAGSMSSVFSNLGTSIRDTVGQTQIFGTSLSSIGSAFNSAGGMATLMQGAVVGLTSALVQMATQAIQKAISSIGEFINQGIELASDLTEIQNVLDAAFGESAEEVNKWATTVASAYGLTEIQAKQYSSTIGSILSGMNITGQQALVMSEQMAQLTGDMASFYNLDHDAAFEKIKSGLTGETEPLKALGIVMNETNLSAFALAEGIETAYSKMSESDKVILRYNYLINQTTLAHGDFAKTQDSYANASATLDNTLDSLSATLGSGLLPVLTTIKQGITELLTKLQPVFDIVGKLVGGMLTTLWNMLSPCIDILKAILTALKPVFDAISHILNGANEAVKAFNKFMGDMVTGFLEKMGLVQESAGETAEYTTEKIVEETDNALGYVDNAIDKWVDDQTKKYREKLEARYGDSLGSAIKIEKLVSQYEEKRRASADSYATAYKRSQEDLTRGTKTEIDKQYSLYEEYYKKLSKLMEGVKSADLTGVEGWASSGVIKRAGNYATGTLYHPGGLAIVGENGRELINLPRGAQVATNRETENFIRGGSRGGDTYIVENVSINASSIQDISDMKNMFSGYTQNSRMGGGR